MGNFKIADSNLTFVGTSKVFKKKEIEIAGIGIIPITIEYDLSEIPKKHHDTCLSMIENGM